MKMVIIIKEIYISNEDPIYKIAFITSNRIDNRKNFDANLS